MPCLRLRILFPACIVWMGVTYFIFIHLIELLKLINIKAIIVVMYTTFKSRSAHEFFSGVIPLLLEICS